MIAIAKLSNLQMIQVINPFRPLVCFETPKRPDLGGLSGKLLDADLARHKNAPATNVVFPQCLGIYICSSNLALMVGFWEIFLGSPSLTVSGIGTFSREFFETCGEKYYF